MKTITLHCECGNVQLFRGVDVQEIVRRIDATEWKDQPDTDGKFGRGHASGICPTCYEAIPN